MDGRRYRHSPVARIINNQRLTSAWKTHVDCYNGIIRSEMEMVFVSEI